MYTAHFGLKAAPFSITPDPNYLYLSVCHREALAHLSYGVSEGPGFVLLTGEVGTGKTTLCRCLIEQLPDTVDVALLLNPRLSSLELLANIFDELRIDYNAKDFTLKNYIDILASYLLTANSVGRKTVLILDEAQNLSTDVLEQVRLLTNLETSDQKLLQIILVGQPELNKLIKRNNLRQLAQRITARYFLSPLSFKDTLAYIQHRLAISGSHETIFLKSAVRLIYQHSKGIPRLINIICDRALLGGYVKGKKQINNRIVNKATKEVRGENIQAISILKTSAVFLIMVFTLMMSAWKLGYLSENQTFNDLMQHKFLTPVTKYFAPVNYKQKISLETNTSETITISQPNEIDITETNAIPKEEPIVELKPKPVNLLEILPTAKTQSAFITLFHLWGLDYNNLKGTKACERAASRGLTCLLRTGTWNDIRSLNRPAILELVMGNGAQHHLVITGFSGDDKVSISILEKSYQFSIQELNQLWLGQFLLLWQPPAMPIPVMKRGLVNDAVIWIRKHLNHHEGRYSELSNLSARFDYTLKNRVVDFQTKHNLEADGIVGEQTMLILQSFSNTLPLLFYTPVINLIKEE